MIHRSLVLALGVAVAAPAATQTPQPVERDLGRLPDAEFEYLAPSPTGRFLALTSFSPESKYTLSMYDRETGESTVLARGRDIYGLAWSPRGDRIAFGQPDESGVYRVYALPIDASTGRVAGPQRRVSTTAGGAPSFSPDGRLIAFASADTSWADGAIVVVPANGGEETRIRPGDGPVAWVTWTTDGWIYYALRAMGASQPTSRVERIRPSGGSPELVVARGTSPWPGVTPDGRVIGVVEGGEANGREMRVFVDPRGTVIGRASTPADVYAEGWAPRGTRLLGTRVTTPRALEVLTLAGGARRAVTEPSAQAAFPSWSPDGRRLAYQTRAGGRRTVAVADADGRNVRTYAAEPELEPGDGAMSWSPDGRRLIYRNRDGTVLVLLEVESGTSRALVRAPILGLNVWRADGRSVVYVRRPSTAVPPPIEVHEVTLDGADRRLRLLTGEEFPGLYGAVLEHERAVYAMTPSGIVVVPLDGGAPRRAVEGPHLRPSTSPDGRWLATPVGVRGGTAPTALDLVPLEGGEPRRLSLGFELVRAEEGTLRWDREGRQIIAVGLRAGGTNAQLFLVPLNGDPPRALADLFFPGERVQLDLSPDGTSLVYTRASRPSARLVEIDFEPVLGAGTR